MISLVLAELLGRLAALVSTLLLSLDPGLRIAISLSKASASSTVSVYGAALAIRNSLRVALYLGSRCLLDYFLAETTSVFI